MRLADGLMDTFTELQGGWTEAILHVRDHLAQLQQSETDPLAARQTSPTH
ncbi:hypothetical protein [Streptomyces xanthophaeus]